MSAPKPCLGYPSRTAAVVAMIERGVKPEKIAARIAAESGQPVTEKMVLDLETSWRRTQQAKVGRLDTVGATIRAAAAIDRPHVLRFLRRLIAEIEP